MRVPTYFQRAAGVLPALPQLSPVSGWSAPAAEMAVTSSTPATRTTVAMPPRAPLAAKPARSAETVRTAQEMEPSQSSPPALTQVEAEPLEIPRATPRRSAIAAQPARSSQPESEREIDPQPHHPVEAIQTRSHGSKAAIALSPVATNEENDVPRARARRTTGNRAAQRTTPEARMDATALESVAERVLDDEVAGFEPERTHRRAHSLATVKRETPAASEVRIGSIEVHVSRPQAPAAPPMPPVAAPAAAAAPATPLARGFATSIGLRQG